MTKLTIIGAGSAVFTKNIFTDLMFIDDFKKMDIALVDIDEKSISKIGQFPWRRDIYSKILKNLNKIGYNFKYEAPQKKIKLIKSFQRHFRQKLINGKIDQEMLLIAENLSKNK